MRNRILALFTAAVMVLGDARAAPWIDPGDEQLRHHIHVLADAGVIAAPVTTWPLPWAAIATDLDVADESSLSDSVRWSLAYVRFSLRQAESSSSFRTRGGLRPDPVLFRDFGSDQREEKELQGELDWHGDRLAVRLQFTTAPDATDGKEYRLDGSYVAAVLGSWSVNVGALERWWGPAWQNSLILSNSARPVPAVSLQRQIATPFETPWFRWMGPWSFTAFAGQLESSRAVPDAKLLGARLALRPFTSVEIGFSRVAQWGGKGRPQDWGSLLDLLQGNDNVGDDGIDDTNEPGNQIGGVDVRIGFPLAGTHSALYGQYVGEDESNGFPSRGFFVVGAESAFPFADLFHRLSLEYADTMVDAHGDNRPNVAYEHRIYQSGYRYFERPLGSTYDNDTRAVSLLLDHYFGSGAQLSWRIGRLALNRDGGNRSGVWGGSPFQAEDRFLWAEICYSFIMKNVKISTSVYNVGEEFYWNDQKIDGTGIGLAIDYKPE